MKKISGIEKRVLTRLARAARLAAGGASGSASPPSLTFTEEPMATCWAGQITIHTLAAMVVPRIAPKAIPIPGTDLQ